jgi:hypothetical protein
MLIATYCSPRYIMMLKQKITLVASMVFASSIVYAASPPSAQCFCEFKSPDFNAYGTNAACGVYMFRDRQSCEISFAGLGANAKVAQSVIGDAAWQVSVKGSRELLSEYAKTMDKDGAEALPIDKAFIDRTLVVIAHGVLFRNAVARADVPMKAISQTISNFVAKYGDAVAQVFQKKRPPFEVEYNIGRISVGVGYVQLALKNGDQLRIVYTSHSG